MKLENLIEEHLIEVVRLYESNLGYDRKFEDAVQQTPRGVLASLMKKREVEYRIGCKYSDEHTKLFFEIDLENNVLVRVNANLDPKDNKGKKYRKIAAVVEKFEEIAREYLNSFK